MKMNSRHVIMSLLMQCIITCIFCQQSNAEITEKIDLNASNIDNESTTDMLTSVLIKIICGPLTAFDRQLLHGEYFNYTDDEINDFRNTGCPRKYNLKKKKKLKNKKNNKNKYTTDYEEFNRRAVEDYENLGNDSKEFDDKNVNKNISLDSQMKTVIIFKVFANDTSLDSENLKNNNLIISTTESVEKSNYSLPDVENSEFNTTHLIPKNSTDEKLIIEENSSSSGEKNLGINGEKIGNKSDSISLVNSSTSNFNNSNDYFYTTEIFTGTTILPIAYHLNNLTEKLRSNYTEIPINIGTTTPIIEKENSTRKFKGLEWVQDDVYRVIPEALNYEINSDDDDNTEKINSSTSKITDDYTDGYQLREIGTSGYGNLSRDQEAIMAIRRFPNHASIDSDQLKTIDRIKQRLLSLSGRDNSNGQTNSQVYRQPLPMLFPECRIPDGADHEAWSNPYYMNLLFQMTLKSRNPIAETLLRIYVLPQTNVTLTNSNANVNHFHDNITISAYSYTKPLDKYPAEKVLLDSVQTPLSSQGSHLVLNITKTQVQNNIESRFPMTILQYGLVIEVKNQRDNLLKPGLYIERDSCNSTTNNTDEKISESRFSSYYKKPVLVIRALRKEEK